MRSLQFWNGVTDDIYLFICLFIYLFMYLFIYLFSYLFGRYHLAMVDMKSQHRRQILNASQSETHLTDLCGTK